MATLDLACGTDPYPNENVAAESFNESGAFATLSRYGNIRPCGPNREAIENLLDKEQ